MTDDAMRAARDRWLADPESAGTGAAFEAGWYACAKAAEGAMDSDPLKSGLEKLREYANGEVCGRITAEEAAAIRVKCGEGIHSWPGPPRDPMAFRAALGAIIPTADLRPPEEIIRELRGDPPTPTGEATTEGKP